MTIPTLMQQFEAQVTTTSLKKTYSVLSQVFTLAVNDNGTPDTWGLTVDSAGHELFLSKLSPYLKFTKNCGTNQGCFPNVTYKYLHGANYSNFDSSISNAKAQLPDGSILGVYVMFPSCNSVYGTNEALKTMCGYAIVDVNGYKSPNQIGIDTFYFYLTKFGFVPLGTPNDTSYTFSGGCKDKTTSQGFACTAWVVHNNNMDYLKCNNLSWTGPTKCN